jgi:hypothetical protein
MISDVVLLHRRCHGADRLHLRLCFLFLLFRLRDRYDDLNAHRGQNVHFCHHVGPEPAADLFSAGTWFGERSFLP